MFFNVGDQVEMGRDVHAHGLPVELSARIIKILQPARSYVVSWKCHEIHVYHKEVEKKVQIRKHDRPDKVRAVMAR